MTARKTDTLTKTNEIVSAALFGGFLLQLILGFGHMKIWTAGMDGRTAGKALTSA